MFRIHVLALVSLLALFFAPPVLAGTADGLTPAVEEVCDGLAGRAFGLCNAYCEAMDCDLEEVPGRACEAVRNNFYRLTGASALPCDDFCPLLPDASCSGNGVLVSDGEGCDVCACDTGWSGSDCATCVNGFDVTGACIPWED